MSKVQRCMVIDLNRCVGCADCDIACKCENNVPDGFAWSNHMIETGGVFPNVQHRYVPVLCNHCTDAPCVASCPTEAMHKTEDGLTKHDSEWCMGCRACQVACPYGAISFNKDRPHRQFAEDQTAAIPGCTATGAEVAAATGTPIPYYNEGRATTMPGIRPRGVVENCSICDHRLAVGELPACVEACPTHARIFGDLNDPESPPSKALAKHQAKVRKPEKGTKPNVFYLREY